MRYKQDAAYELSQVNAQIASNRRSADNVTKRTSAGILDACLPSLLARQEALTAELATLPERPQRELTANHTFTFHYAKHFADDMPDLPIPEFLRRMPT